MYNKVYPKESKHLARQRNSPGKIDPTLWVLLGYFALFVLLFRLAPNVLGALTLGWFLSMIIEVPARLLSKVKFISYRLGVVVSGFFVFALLVLGITLLIPILVEEGGKILGIITTQVGSLDLDKVITLQNEDLKRQIVDIGNTLISNLSSQISSLGGQVLNLIIQKAPGAITSTLLFVIAASYFTAVIPVIHRNLWRFFPRQNREKAIGFVVDFYGDLRHFIRGQITIALLVGLSMGVGMLIAGIPHALFLAFLAGITNFIPFLGLIISAIPALLLGVTNGGLWGFAKVLIVIVVTNQLETWVFSPRVQGKRMRLNWFLIIIAVFLCAQFLGIIGVLLAIPLLVFFRDFWIGYVQEAFKRL